MIIKRTSYLTGVTRERDLPVTQAQLDEFYLPLAQRRYIQDIFPDLSASDREFIKTGITDEEWEEHWGEDA